MEKDVARRAAIGAYLTRYRLGDAHRDVHRREEVRGHIRKVVVDTVEPPIPAKRAELLLDLVQRIRAEDTAGGVETECQLADVLAERQDDTLEPPCRHVEETHVTGSPTLELAREERVPHRPYVQKELARDESVMQGQARPAQKAERTTKGTEVPRRRMTDKGPGGVVKTRPCAKTRHVIVVQHTNLQEKGPPDSRGRARNADYCFCDFAALSKTAFATT